MPNKIADDTKSTSSGMMPASVSASSGNSSSSSSPASTGYFLVHKKTGKTTNDSTGRVYEYMKSRDDLYGQNNLNQFDVYESEDAYRKHLQDELEKAQRDASGSLVDRLTPNRKAMHDYAYNEMIRQGASPLQAEAAALIPATGGLASDMLGYVWSPFRSIAAAKPADSFIKTAGKNLLTNTMDATAFNNATNVLKGDELSFGVPEVAGGVSGAIFGTSSDLMRKTNPTGSEWNRHVPGARGYSSNRAKLKIDENKAKLAADAIRNLNLNKESPDTKKTSSDK